MKCINSRCEYFHPRYYEDRCQHPSLHGSIQYCGKARNRTPEHDAVCRTLSKLCWEYKTAKKAIEAVKDFEDKREFHTYTGWKIMSKIATETLSRNWINRKERT